MITPEYFLPFDTSVYPIRISQGNNGPWSHKLIKRSTLSGVTVVNDLVYAVDFALPLGTEVRAARAGRIISTYLDGTWCYEGLDPELGNPSLSKDTLTNHIFVMHEDGTLALYSHLAKDSLQAKKDIVRVGEPLVLTGKSGWIGEIPHLHFMVTLNNLKTTLPITFQDYVGSLDHETLAREGKIWFGDEK